MEYLNVKALADLKGCSVRYIQNCISKGKISAVQELNPQNNCKQYMIPVSSLPEELQKKYYAQARSEAMLCLPAVQKESKAGKPPAKVREHREFGSFNAEEREQIAFWTEIIREWRIRREEYESAAEGDMVYVAEVKRLKREYLAEHNIKISRDILYRKYRYYKENDLEGLTECRGGSNKGKNSIPPELSRVFSDLYLCDNELPVSDCYRFTREWAMENRPELLPIMPGERTFRRAAEKIPEAVVAFFRKSRKECIDECMPYIIRMYDEIEANDVWVADNHTFDFMTRGEDGKVHRMYITGFLDAKTGALVGWNITKTPNSESTILALRHAIMRCGIPKCIYVDNGREFLTYDFGGKGHRSRKSKDNELIPPSILKRLGIEMVNAIPENGRAKPIERMFLTLKNTISRCMKTFTGGNIIERPESLKYHLKHGIVPWDMELREQLDKLLDGYNGSPYGGCEPQFKGMSRAEAWCRSIRRRTLRMCDELTLNLLLMRNTRYQKVRENGVYITISGEKLYYMAEDNWRYVGQEVYVRYDPSDLERVYIYDRSDKYIGEWFAAKALYVDYITGSKEDIAAGMQLIARQIRAVKACGKELTGDMQIDAFALAVAEANRKLDAVAWEPPKEIEYIKSPEQLPLKRAVGDDVAIDMAAMAQRAESRIKMSRKDEY